jgi:hypothetical protein
MMPEPEDNCREMFTRKCPISGCVDLPCARFETEDESRWDLDRIEWENTEPKRRPGMTYEEKSHRCVAPVYTTLPLLGPGFYRCKRCDPCKRNMTGESARAMESLKDPKWSWNRFPVKHLRMIGYYHVRNYLRGIFRR